MKKAKTFIIVFMIGLLLLSFSSTIFAEEDRYGGTLEVGLYAEPAMLDKYFTIGLVGWEVVVNKVEPLFEYDENWEIQPFLVDEYQVEDDGRLHILNLRENVMFHNGEEMTSEDVTSSIERFQEHNSYFKDFIEPYLEDITSTNRYSIEIKLSDTGWLLPYVLQECPIYPKELNEKYFDEPIPAEELVSTGPYKLNEWADGHYIELVRFEEYVPDDRPFSGHAGERKPYLDKIRFNIAPEASIRIAGAQTGEYDISLELPPDAYERIEGDERLNALVTQPYGFPYIAINNAGGALSDPDNVKLRQAFLAALDMEAMMKVGFGNEELYDVDGSIYSKMQPLWHSDKGTEYFNQNDPDKAQELLKEAGYDNEPIRFLTSTEYDFLYKISVVMREQLEDAGFNIDLQVLDWGTLLERRTEKEGYEAFISYNSFSAAPPLRLGWIVSDFPSWWVNEEKDRLVSELALTEEYSEQYKAWEELQALIYEEVPAVVPGHFFRLSAANANVKGVQERFVMPLFNVWLEE